MNAMAVDHFFDSADGLRLYARRYVADRRDALPLLCLPGLTRNSRDFIDLAEHLQPQHEVLAADLRGRGRSAWDSEPSHYALPFYVQDAFALLDSCHIERSIIVGTSLGALMGLAMAAMRPQRVAGLVLNDAGPELELVGLRRIAGYAGKLPAVSSWPQAVAQAKSVYGAALPDLSEAEWLTYTQRAYRENEAGAPVPDMDPMISDAFKVPPAASLDLWGLYDSIGPVPILVIRGGLSDLLSEATVARMVRQKPQVQQLTLANRGHTPLLNEPPARAAIDAFVAQYGRGGSES